MARRRRSKFEAHAGSKFFASVLLILLSGLFTINHQINFDKGLASPNSTTTQSFLPLVMSPPSAPGFVPPDFGTSRYEVTVTLPNCDEKALIIDETTDINEIDWQAYDVFCVQAGNYTIWGELKINNVDGTAAQPKVLRYYDSVNAAPPHPVERANDPLHEAVFQNFLLIGSDFWIFDGLTIRSSPTSNRVFDSSNNIFNRMLIEEGDTSLLRISGDSDNTVLQNSVLRNHSDKAIQEDKVCVLLYTDPSEPAGLEIENTHIVNNEIYNCNDGVALLDSSVDNPVFYPGTIVENNDIYITDELYTDCMGNRNPNGACACAENAIDIKATIDEEDLADVATWVRFINNRVWGYRYTDESEDGQGKRLCGSGDNGSAIRSHNISRGLVMQGNVIMDSPKGLSVDGVDKPFPPTTNHFFVNNLLYNIHDCYDPDKQGIKQFLLQDKGQFLGCVDENDMPTNVKGIGFDTSGNEKDLVHYGNTYYGNTVIDVGDRENLSGEWADILDAGETYLCNVVLNSPGKEYAWHQTNIADRNAYYDSIPYCPGSAPCENQNLIQEPTVAAAKHAPFMFNLRRWTNPGQFTIPDALPTSETPEFSTGGVCWIDAPNHPWNQ
jgi:hypothetical protein